MKKFVFLFLFLFVVESLAAQQKTDVSGKVTEFGNNLPMVGVSVSIDGTYTGTSTDLDGFYTLKGVPSNSVLVFSFLFMKTQRISVEGRSIIDVVLEEEGNALDEVVVVGYGTQRAKDLTAPIAVIKGSDLTSQSVANAAQALQGKIAGVQVINSGVPGAGASIKIRGVGSIGDYANPLYVVDGVFVDNIDFVNSSDIETINILKDASAAAIYGVRAANGVILITTKRGIKGKTAVNYDGYVGLQIPVNIMPLTNRDQYVELLNEAFANTPGYIPKDAKSYPTTTDWYQELVRNAIMHSHSVDLTGATDVTNYAIGINYLFQEGIMNSKNDYERLNIRGRLDQNVNSWLKIGFTTLISNNTQFSPNNADVFYRAFVNPPVYPVYDDNNTDAYPVAFGSPQMYGFSNTYGNPFAVAYYNNNREKGFKTIFSAYAEVNIIPEKLNFKTAYNLNFEQWMAQNYQPEYFVGGSQGLRQSNLSKTFGIRSKHIVDNTLTYNNKNGRSFYSIMLGQSMRIEKGSTMTGSAINVPGYDDQSIYLVNGSSRDKNATDSGFRYNGLSFFMRGTYNLDNKYLATITFRADGSSKYNDHWGYFPSVGLGWNLSEESFMQDQKWTDFMKIRASWGLLGNDNVPTNSTYILGLPGASSSAIFGDRLVDGVGAQTVFRNYLKWEVVSEFNIGLVSHYFKNRLTTELDYYHRTTYNVVFNAPIATGGGVTDLLANNGTVLNQGVEFSLRWNGTINDKINYNIGFNATTISNKVTALNGRDTPIPGGLVRGNFSTTTQIGYPIGSFWGYEIEGVYANAKDALQSPVNQAIKDAGYFIYKDQNNDNIITEKDKVYLGSPIPWLIAGLDFGLYVGKFDFGLTLQSQVGNKILNAKRMNRDVFPDGNYDINFYKNVWRSDRKSNTYPSAEAYNTSFTQQANSFFVEDASYVRLQNIQVGYTLNNCRFVESIRIYASAQRPFTFFTYNGFTPEVSGSPIESGIDRSVYPMQAIYSLGIKANF
ncbi:MAG: TonB-dependent receptor [Prevotellaceae bacterium]|jgi:TonB-linked SusC/RagA family outer membrane protein|nr:TonB-dependent receptor [Prevotellaceae bacterium]